MDGSINFASRADRTAAVLMHRFVTTLENRQKEHDMKRRKLKADWTKQKKQLDSCAEELRRSRQNLNTKEGGYLKARDLALRHELSVPPTSTQPNIGILGTVNDPQKKRKELEKKRKNEEDALNRKTDAENEVWRLERELESRRIGLNELRLQIVSDLCDLIRHCDLTTTACASHFFKAFAELWAPIPEEFDRLAAYAIRESSPGSEYMSFLQNQYNTINNPTFSKTIGEDSSGNLQDTMGGRRTSPTSTQPHSQHHPLISNSVPSSANCSLSMDSNGGPRRRNALNADEHYELIAETTQRRQKKSMTRLFEQSSSSICETSDAAKSHQLSKTRQVTKCAQCEHLVIFDALKCSTCGIVWHKKCLSQVQVFCGPSARRLTAETAAYRRMSIFGVSLGTHLEAQHRKIPLIMEKCIDELQKRGMSCKGLYRTCGVKSKIEQLCVMFEQTAQEVDLSEVHPMNIASVIKLYLRRLPEPLLTYEMYREWLDFDPDIGTTAIIKGLRDLVSRLPLQNFDTLKFLVLHLKRVTWFELENLMTASNLAAVIAPSLIWQRICGSAPHSAPAFNSMSAAQQQSTCNAFINDAHQQSKIVELLIQNAFEVFLTERSADWQQFFETYPDVEEPKLVDAETEACITKKSNQIECCGEGEDLNEEIYGLCDMDESCLPTTITDCSTSFGSGTQSGTGNNSSSSAPNEEPCGFGANCVQSPLECLIRKNLCRAEPEQTLRLNNTANYSPSPRKPSSKQRSFTTSILVSPLADRKFNAIMPTSADPESRNAPGTGLFAQQKNLGETSRSFQRLVTDESFNFCDQSPKKSSETQPNSFDNEKQMNRKYSEKNDNSETVERTLCSGEVVVNIKKDQYCLPNSYLNTGSRKTSAAGRLPLSSASFNAITHTHNEATPKISSDNSSNDSTTTTNQVPPRRRRLERSNYISNAGPEMYAKNINNNMDSPMPSTQQTPSLCNTTASVGVVFTGNDVSYV